VHADLGIDFQQVGLQLAFVDTFVQIQGLDGITDALAAPAKVFADFLKFFAFDLHSPHSFIASVRREVDRVGKS
jgi:hypothetical protein